MKTCPHCQKPLPTKLRWKTLYSGQTDHVCPACAGRFRLTYAAKRRVAFLNLILLMGLVLIFSTPDLLRNATIYVVVAIVTLLILPMQADYESVDTPKH